MKMPVKRRTHAMYCVLIGDIIKSKEIAPDVRVRVLNAAKDAFDRINTKYSSSLMAPFGMVRGDAFEGVLLSQSHAPKIIQEIIKAFYRVEKTCVRISLAIDQLTTIGSDRNEVDGPAFYKALENLETLKKRDSNHWLQVAFETNSLAQPIIESQLRLLSTLTGRWTDNQREIVWSMEAHSMQQKLVSNALGKVQSVVDKQLKAANYEEYISAWESLEKYLMAHDEGIVTGRAELEKSYLAYYSVALRKYDQCYYDEAAHLFEKSLKLAIEDLGEDDQQLVPIYNELASSYQRLSESNKAEKIISKSVVLQSKLPKARLQYIETVQVEAEIYMNQYNYESAKEKLIEALDIARTFLSESHPSIGNICNSIAICYAEEEDYDNALIFFTEALKIDALRKGVFPVDYAVVKANTACYYYKTGNYEEAIPMLKDSLRIMEENLPPKNDHIKWVKKELALAEAGSGGE